MKQDLTTTSPHEVAPLPLNLKSVQPGGGFCYRLELMWGYVRRGYLSRFRKSYVASMRQLRMGSTRGVTHPILDPRDLKYCRNQCTCDWDKEENPFAWRNDIPLARWGLGEVVIMGGIFLLCAALLMLSPWPLSAVIPMLLFAFVLYFFRDPHRHVPQEPGLFVSPADGTVAEVTQVDHDSFIGGPAVRIGIFLSVFNVHINRASLRSKVLRLEYHPGLFLNALDPDSAMRNENLWIGFQAVEQPACRYVVRQIAGLIARRIVCELRPGEIVPRGHKFGMIKLGSRTELIVPKNENCLIEVQVGDRVRGGATILARWNQTGDESGK